MHEINQYNDLKNQWDKTIKQIGDSTPSDNGHTSIFLYPFAYSSKIKKNLVTKLEKENWSYENKSKNDFHKISKITDYLKDSLFLGKSIETTNLLFSKKLNSKFELWVDGIYYTNFTIDLLESIFFYDNIFIFSMFTSSMDTIDTISIRLNRELRNPNCLFFDEKNSRFLSFDNQLKNFDELIRIYNDKYNVKIISFVKYIKDIALNTEEFELQELKSGKSKYAKFITSIHCEVDEDTEQKLVYQYPQLQHETDVALNVLNICSDKLSTANNLSILDKKFEPDIDFVRKNIGNYGIRLWSYWGGVASLNSLAFISINSGGRSIVHQSKNEIYLIFLINIYIKLRLQRLDKNIIDDSFMQIAKSRANLEDLFDLKAKYFSEEIADSFQPILIDKKIKLALGIDNLMLNIEENIIKTNEIIKENSSTAIALILALYATVNTIIPLYTDSKITQYIILVVGVIFGFIGWKKRNKLGKYLDRLLK